MLDEIFNLIKKIKRVFFPFYKDKELKFVFQKLQEGLPNNKIAARFVGGCVRKYPHIKKILTNIKNEKGCFLSRMTGSGSVCYGLFRDQIVAKKALNKLKNKYPKFWFSLAKTV